MRLDDDHLSNAERLWHDGYAAWRGTGDADQRAEYRQVIDAIKERLAECETLQVLIDRYVENNDWCMEIAQELFPDKPCTWRLSIVQDAAYWLRSEEIQADDSGRLPRVAPTVGMPTRRR